MSEMWSNRHIAKANEFLDMLKTTSLVLLSLATVGVVGFAAPPTHAATSSVYKSVDEDGNVAFSDVPPDSDSKAVEVLPANTFPAAKPQSQPRSPRSQDSTTDEPSYQSITITAPTNELAIRDNAGNVTISVSMEPSLDTTLGHRFRLVLDGKPLLDGTSSNFALANVDRGAHQVVVEAIDAEGNVLIASQPITFHMLRASVSRQVTPRNR